VHDGRLGYPDTLMYATDDLTFSDMHRKHIENNYIKHDSKTINLRSWFARL